jgi:hypothetical protein
MVDDAKAADVTTDEQRDMADAAAERTADKAADQVPYQQAAQVRQLLAERANAVAYDQQTRVDAVDKQLAELGVTPEMVSGKTAKAGGAPEKVPPQGRTAPQRATADAAPEAEVEAAPRRGPGRPRKSTEETA